MISPSNGSAWASTTPLGRSHAEYASTQPLGGRRAAPKRNKRVTVLVVALFVVVAVVAGLVAWLLLDNGSKRGPAIEFGGDDYEAAAPEAAVVEEVAVEEAAPVDRSNDSGDRVWVKGEASDHKGSYPIRMTFEMSPSGRFVGKYAYEVTLRKYGRGPSSWFVIDGTCGRSNGYYTDVEAYTYMYGESEPFERLDLIVGPDCVTGTLTNLATGEVFDINLH